MEEKKVEEGKKAVYTCILAGVITHVVLSSSNNKPSTKKGTY